MGIGKGRGIIEVRVRGEGEFCSVRKVKKILIEGRVKNGEAYFIDEEDEDYDDNEKYKKANFKVKIKRIRNEVNGSFSHLDMIGRNIR